MSTNQVFGSALRQPWALMIYGSNAQVGRRPASSVVYLTDDEGDHYLGGEVAYYRKRMAPAARWYYRYQKAKRIPKDQVLHRFPSDNKGYFGGPSSTEIARARRALPVTALTDVRQ